MSTRKTASVHKNGEFPEDGRKLLGNSHYKLPEGVTVHLQFERGASTAEG